MKKLWQKSIRLLALFLAVVLVATTISGNAQAASRKKKVVVFRENMNQQIHLQQVLWKIFTEDRK